MTEHEDALKPSNRFSAKAFVVNLLVLAGFVLLVAGVAAFGGLFSARTSGEWYQNLEMPPWQPPSWVFGPVWTILYILIAVSGWLTWRRTGLAGQGLRAMTVYLIQLALNGVWPLLFFGLERPGLAFGGIVCLWVAIVLNGVLFWRSSRVAAALLAPYLAWVTFAAALNLYIWLVN